MTSTVQSAAHAHTRTGASRIRGTLCGDILAEAYRQGMAAPVAIHVRPELDELLRAGPAVDAQPTSLPMIVDADLPASPGYEIHREPPGAQPGPGRTDTVPSWEWVSREARWP
jgi:hypothetical protein